MKQIIDWDRELFLRLNNLGKEFWDPFWLEISEVFVWIPFYAILLFLLFRKLALRDFFIAIALIAINTVLTDQLSVILFKEQFMRLRPCHVDDLLQQMRLVKDGCGGKYGFVSSHAANTFGMAVLVGYIMKPFYKKALLLLLIWALIISYSRIYLGVHYPLDVIGGAVLGSLIALIMIWFYNFFKR